MSESVQPLERQSTLSPVAVRHCVANMEAYAGPASIPQLARRHGIPLEQFVKLDSNENPYGPSPRVRPALAAFDEYHRYPDADQRELREWIGGYVGLNPDYIMAGNGADEMIDLLMKAYLDPGDEMLDFPPSFAMYAYNAQHYDARVVEVERDERFAIDPDRALAALSPRTKIIILTSPNNPTGNSLPPETVTELLKTGRLVIVDEAYTEFSGGSIASWVPSHDNLVVLRTFSKWAGLAGLRIGFALLPAAVSQHLWKLKPPFNINQAAVVAVRESLLDRDYLMANVRKIVLERDRLLARLAELGYVQPYPSESNFILCRILGRDALELRDALAARGVLVRHYRSPRIRDCLRISVGSPEQNDVLLSALRELAVAG